MACAAADHSLGDRIKQAVNTRNRNFGRLKSDVKRQCDSYLRSGRDRLDDLLRRQIESNRDESLKYINDIKSSPINVAVCGRVNTGKSMLVSELVENVIRLPSDDEPDAGKMTRIVYCRDNFGKNIHLQCSAVEQITHKNKKFSSEYKFPKINDYEEQRGEKIQWNNLQNSIKKGKPKKGKKGKKGNKGKEKPKNEIQSMVEIGLPIEFLKNNIRIIDFPGFGLSKARNDWIFCLLVHQKPTIICYVYDFQTGFNQKDAEILDTIHCCLMEKDKSWAHYGSYIMIANKVDQDGNEFDSVIGDSDKFLREIEFLKIKGICHFKRSYQFDVQKLQPVNPLSTGELYLDKQNPSERKKLCDLYNRIIEKIENSYGLAADIIAFKFRQNLQDNHFKQLSEDEEWRSFWFDIKSKSVDEETIQYVQNIINDNTKLLLDFKYGYQIFCDLKHEDSSTQITSLSRDRIGELNFSEEMRRVYMAQRHHRNVLFLSRNGSTIYIIDRNMPTKRLLDKVALMTPEEIHAVISSLEEKFHSLNVRNNRPDTLFVDTNDNIKLNPNIPNLPELPFLPAKKENEETKETKPVHMCSFIESRFLEDWNEVQTQNIFCLGWCIWLVLGGRCECVTENSTIEDRLNLLKSDKEFTYPQYLDRVMFDCWRVSLKASFNYVERIRRIIRTNYWIHKHSYDINYQSKTEIDNSRSSLIDYGKSFKVYQIKKGREKKIISELSNYSEVDYQPITSVVNLIEYNEEEVKVQTDGEIQDEKDDQHSTERKIYYAKDEGVNFTNEKVRLYHNNHKENSFQVYLNREETSLFIIEMNIPEESDRLLDKVHSLTFPQVEDIIVNFVKQNETIRSNFRPDNLFIDSNNHIYQLHGIPNHPSIPLLLKDRSPVDPFHLHVDVQNQRVSGIIYEYRLHYLNNVQNVFGFGWLVWILLEGSGDKCPSSYWNENITEEVKDLWIDEAKSGRFKESWPPYLVEVMKRCWSAGFSRHFSAWKNIRDIFKYKKI